MKILIVSDNHGRTGNLEQVIKEQGKIDYFLHAGDTEGSEDYIEALLDCPSAIVGGNNDYFSGLPSELTVKIGKYKVWITHGHMDHAGGAAELKVAEANVLHELDTFADFFQDWVSDKMFGFGELQILI